MRNAQHLLFHPFGIGDAAAVKSPLPAAKPKAIAPVGSESAVALHADVLQLCRHPSDQVTPAMAAGVLICSGKMALDLLEAFEASRKRAA